MTHDPGRLGAIYLGEGTAAFRIWAPRAERAELRLHGHGRRSIALLRDGDGYHQAVVDGVHPGARYTFVLDGAAERPDPASRHQPEDVHGPSEVIDPRFAWTDDAWFGLPLSRYVIYELHVGAFTPEGTFNAVIPHLDELGELGVTAIELMPVAQFPGHRNWGYDGVYPYATQHSYGGPDGLRRLVDACHARGMAVVLDVVYNHLGPEGNYLHDFGPYYTDRYRTPWGAALNFDGPESDHVRRFFIESALMWVADFHIDAFRLDAIQAIVDHTPVPFLQELADAVHREAERCDRRVHLIAESAWNDAKTVRPAELGGLGHDAQWNDDFHHALHALLTGERDGYYADYGRVEHLAKAYREGYVYTGEYSPYHRRRHGSATTGLSGSRFVVFSQNHDQVGNRMLGERRSTLVPFPALKLAAAATMLAPNIPLIFMGEEYGELAPFQYFISHQDAELVEAVRRGRREEFAAFSWLGEAPDPQDEATFRRCILDQGLRDQGDHRALYELYRELLRLRRGHPILADLDRARTGAIAYERQRVLVLHRASEAGDAIIAVLHFGAEPRHATVIVPPGRWRRLLDCEEERWSGSGNVAAARIESAGELELALAPYACLVFEKELTG